MNQKQITRWIFQTLLVLLGVFHAGQTWAQQTTAFTYQGQLRDGGTNASGTYGLTFKLFDAVTSGSQVGGTLTSSALLVNGLFSVNLDFGSVFDGGGRWLDITVQNGTNAPETLAPRVAVLPAPYALFATKAGSLMNGAVQNPTFLGTTDMTPLALSVNNQPVLRLQPFTNTANLIGGYSGNVVSNGFVGATIAGGGASVTPEAGDGLPSPNIIGANYATIGGGVRNTATGIGSTVPGGAQNVASGIMSFAVGSRANAIHNNTFVWNDSSGSPGDFSSTTNNEFSVKALGGVRFETGGKGLTIDGTKVSPGIPNFQVFNASGTFTVPTGVTRIMIEVWGGGGGGGGNGTNIIWLFGTAVGGNGGGGGGGGYGKQILSVTPDDNMAVTVGSGGNSGGGDGGTSSLGSVSATGGAGGNNGGNAYTVIDGPTTYYRPGNPGNGGNPGTSTAPARINGVQGGGGAAISGAGYNSAVAGSGNGQGGAGGNGGAGGGAGGSFPGSIMNGQSPGGGGAGGGFGAPGRVIIWY